MGESVFLELQNASFTWFALCLIVIFIRYMIIHFDMGYKFLRGAIALSTVWFGQFLTRAPLWWTRYYENQGHEVVPPDLQVAIGVGISIVGFLCVIRVFSEESLKKWTWILSLAGMLIVCTASYYKVLPI